LDKERRIYGRGRLGPTGATSAVVYGGRLKLQRLTAVHDGELKGRRASEAAGKRVTTGKRV